MQRIVTKNIQLVLALVNAFFPVDIEDALGNGCNLVNLIGIEGDNAQTNQVGDIFNGLILRTLQFQFSCQRLLSLHPILNSRDIDALFAQLRAQQVVSILCQLFQRRAQFAELLHQCLAMWVKLYHFPHL